jgi:hypothetical protein
MSEWWHWWDWPKRFLVHPEPYLVLALALPYLPPAAGCFYFGIPFSCLLATANQVPVCSCLLLSAPCNGLASLAWVRTPWRTASAGHAGGPGCCPGFHPFLASASVSVYVRVCGCVCVCVCVCVCKRETEGMERGSPHILHPQSRDW